MNHLTLQLIDPNPWQTRATDDPAHIQAIADSIRENRAAGIGEHGLLQVPMGRTVGDRFQLAFGMSRLAAWQIANPDLPFPVNVVELTDRQMSDLAAEENAKRKNLDVIEIGYAITRRMKEFDLTQIEAAKPFGYTNQGTIANILRLGKLPAEVRTLVQEHKLAERNARALLVVERIAPDKTAALALKSISAENPENAIDEAIENLVWQNGRHLGDAAFKPSWPKNPIPTASLFDPAGDETIAELPTCIGCAFLIRRPHSQDVCVRPVCYDAKQQIALDNQLPGIARQSGIPLAGKDEKTFPLWDGGGIKGVGESYEMRPKIARLVKARLPELRLVPCEGAGGEKYNRETALGSRWVALAATDLKPVLAWLKASTDKQKEAAVESLNAARAENRNQESNADKRKRIEREKREEQERRAERSAFLKSKYDTLWLLAHVADVVEPDIDIGGGILRLAEHNICQNSAIYSEWSPMQSYAGTLANKASSKKYNPADSESFLVKRIVYHVLAHQVSSAEYGIDAEKVYDFSRARKIAERVAIQTFGVALPRGWDDPPVHHTAVNCWHCGKFAPNEKGLSQRDLQDGWCTPSNQVFCSQAHHVAYGKTQPQDKPAKKAKR